jgi:hypothetical protein
MTRGGGRRMTMTMTMTIAKEGTEEMEEREDEGRDKVERGREILTGGEEHNNDYDERSHRCPCRRYHENKGTMGQHGRW